MLSASDSDARRTGVTAGHKALAVVGAAWAVIAASVTFSVDVRSPLASPALAVKSGRQRGLSVLERRRLEMESIAAADAAAAAKRQKRCKVPAKPVVDPSLPNGVGIQSRGRAGINSPLANGSDCVVAMQQRRQSLLAAAEYRPTRSVIVLATAGAGNFNGMRQIGMTIPKVLKVRRSLRLMSRDLLTAISTARVSSCAPSICTSLSLAFWCVVRAQRPRKEDLSENLKATKHENSHRTLELIVF